MKLPYMPPQEEWFAEGSIRQLKAKVEGLQLEKIELGRRTLRKVAAFDHIALGSAVLVICTLCFGLTKFANPEKLSHLMLAPLMLLIILCALTMHATWLMMRRFSWENSRKDGPAEAWKNCEEACETTVWTIIRRNRTTFALCIPLLAMDMLLGGNLASLILFASLMNGASLNTAGQGRRGLLALCRDSEPKQPAKAKAMTLRERLAAITG